MAEDKQHISLQLAANPVSLSIPRDKEPFYREAAALLNRRYAVYQRSMPQASAEHIWMYLALEVAVNLQSDARDKALQPVEKKLGELDDEIKRLLNQPTSNN